MAKRSVLQFKIILQDIKPTVWRRIQISDLCSFWDLHVAIQDAMGWEDRHLHHFEMNHSITEGKHYMGIPAYDDDDVLNTLPGWDYRVRHYLVINKQFPYVYDYGDNWEHLIEYEDLHEKQLNCKYPVCIDGKGACPPEDVGGSMGYYNFLAAIKDPFHEEHHHMLTWAGGSFDPNYFDANKVKFDNPRKRWQRAFVEEIT